MEQEQNHRNGDHMEGYPWGRGRERMRGKLQGIRSTICRYKNRQGKVKNSIGNGGAKELVSITHGHELRGGIAGGNGGTRQKGTKRIKKWDNYNSIIN